MKNQKEEEEEEKRSANNNNRFMSNSEIQNSKAWTDEKENQIQRDVKKKKIVVSLSPRLDFILFCHIFNKILICLRFFELCDSQIN